MSMEQIRSTYGVPARRGQRVVFDGLSGTIVAARGGYLRVRFDGEKGTRSLHPVWQVQYVAPSGETDTVGTEQVLDHAEQ